jgi:hypothetical protein
MPGWHVLDLTNSPHRPRYPRVPRSLACLAKVSGPVAGRDCCTHWSESWPSQPPPS